MLLNQLAVDFGLAHWSALVAISGIGGFMRGFAGFGTTLVMVPLFSLLLSPTQAVVIGLSIDVMVMAPLFPGAVRQAEWKPIVPLFIGSLMATPLGVYILLIAPADTMRIVIALIVISSAFLIMSGWTYQGKKTTMISFCVGVVAGTSGWATAIGGPPIAIYMLARGLTAIQTRASLNAMAFIKEGISAVSIFLQRVLMSKFYL